MCREKADSKVCASECSGDWPVILACVGVRAYGAKKVWHGANAPVARNKVYRKDSRITALISKSASKGLECCLDISSNYLFF
jgi:hypothetical protein